MGRKDMKPFICLALFLVRSKILGREQNLLVLTEDGSKYLVGTEDDGHSPETEGSQSFARTARESILPNGTEGDRFTDCPEAEENKSPAEKVKDLFLKINS